MTAFEKAFEIVIGHEGGYCCEADDPGNWTGGVVGEGDLRGTKYGISASSYPTIDIRSLGLSEAQAIYRRDYWERVHGDALPPALALLVFDAGVNNGVGRAIRWLQIAAGTDVDGIIGPRTEAAAIAAFNQAGVAGICAEFQAQRTNFMANLTTWRNFGLGWARRLCALAYQSIEMS